MTKILHGEVRGRNIELDEVPGVAEGQEVEIQMTVVPVGKEMGRGHPPLSGRLGELPGNRRHHGENPPRAEAGTSASAGRMNGATFWTPTSVRHISAGPVSGSPFHSIRWRAFCAHDRFGELYAGAYHVSNPAPLLQKIADLLNDVQVLDYDPASPKSLARCGVNCFSKASRCDRRPDALPPSHWFDDLNAGDEQHCRFSEHPRLTARRLADAMNRNCPLVFP